MTHEWYSSYDALVQRVCPDYETGLEAVVSAIPGRTRSILELGSGTGNLTAKLAQEFPNIPILGIDSDEIMLQLAKEKTKDSKNLLLVKGELPHANFSRFGTAVSSLMLHLMPESDARKTLQKVYNIAYNVLVFDRVRGETSQEEDRFFGYFVRNVLGLNLPKDIAYELITESAGNSPLMLSEHRKICESYCFTFRVLHQNINHGFVAYSGTKNK